MSELENKRQKWYETIPVQYELLRAMRDREVIFLHKKDNWKCIRGMCIRNIPALKFLFDYFKFFKKDYNIYVSCAKYNHIPQFTTDLTQRSAETSKWFKETAEKSIIDYDILLDFDCKNPYEFPLLQNEVIKVIRILNTFFVNYNIYPSGRHYQITVPTFNKIPMDDIKEIMKRFIERFGLKYLDKVGVGSFNKIRKCEYSLVEDRVCLPISNISNIHSTKDSYTTMYDSNVILRDVIIKNRGLGYHNAVYLDSDKANNLLIFLKSNLLLEV